jgi:DUF971 family protein
MDFGEGSLDPTGEVLTFRWKGGRTQKLSAAFLRCHCPCATCRHLAFPLEPSMFPGLTVLRTDPVGSYAFQFEFSDHHNQGAFSYDKILEFPDEA